MTTAAKPAHTDLPGVSVDLLCLVIRHLGRKARRPNMSVKRGTLNRWIRHLGAVEREFHREAARPCSAKPLRRAKHESAVRPIPLGGPKGRKAKPA
jgi:hypothetical protein